MHFLRDSGVCSRNGGGIVRDTLKTRAFTVLYGSDKSAVDENYRDNNTQADSIRSFLSHSEKIDSVIICSWASPDGPYKYNASLARLRGDKARNFLLQIKPDIDPESISIVSGAENWESLADRIRSEYPRQDKEKVLSIIYDESIGNDTREWRLKKLDEGRSWRYLLRHYIWTLRSVTYVFAWTEDMDAMLPAVESIGTDPMRQFAEPLLQTGPAMALPAQTKTVPRRTVFALHTNLLVPALNFGVEVPLGNRWSVEADYYYPWLKRNSHHKECFQVLAWSVGGRYWFGKNRTENDRLKGHSLGLDAMAGYYDIERNYAGHQGEFVNVSVDYLFALPVCRDRLHIEFTAGLGYFISKARPYDVFEDGGKAYKKGYSKVEHWIGPNKIGVNLVVPIKAKRRAGR